MIPVTIKWWNEEYDWPTYFILHEIPEGLLLRGRDDDEGNKHQGDIFFAYWEEIKKMTQHKGSS